MFTLKSKCYIWKRYWRHWCFFNPGLDSSFFKLVRIIVDPNPTLWTLGKWWENTLVRMSVHAHALSYFTHWAILEKKILLAWKMRKSGGKPYGHRKNMQGFFTHVIQDKFHKPCTMLPVAPPFHLYSTSTF